MSDTLFEPAFPPLLASIDFHSPILWAIIIGWILSVTVHELAHGIVASLGGDYTIRERGGLTLNPLKYIDPVVSIILPLFFLLIGGVPLPGGVTYVRRDLLRSKLWETAVSLAGPTVNAILFLLCVLPFHPRIGWMHPSFSVSSWTPMQLFLPTMAILQFEILIINLMPIPPLDGFGAIRPYFDERSQQMFSSPMVVYAGFFTLSFIVLGIPAVQQGIFLLAGHTLQHMGFSDARIETFGDAFNKALRGA